MSSHTSLSSGNNNSADALLEEYLETIAFLPSNLKRNLNLLASLDNAAERLGQKLKKLEEERLDNVQNIVEHARKNANLEKQTKDEKAMNPEPLAHKWIHTKHCDGDVFATKQK